MRSFILIATLCLATGCPGESEPVWETQTASDDGNACVSGEADAAGTVTVVANVCLSSSCSRSASGTCTATVDGSTITVTSEFEWEVATGDIACTDDCGALTATCLTDVLPAGEYTIEHGTGSDTVTIPNDEPCDGAF